MASDQSLLQSCISRKEENGSMPSTQNLGMCLVGLVRRAGYIMRRLLGRGRPGRHVTSTAWARSIACPPFFPTRTGKVGLLWSMVLGIKHWVVPILLRMGVLWNMSIVGRTWRHSVVCSCLHVTRYLSQGISIWRDRMRIQEAQSVYMDNFRHGSFKCPACLGLLHSSIVNARN
jgi:hypothetical protein